MALDELVWAKQLGDGDRPAGTARLLKKLTVVQQFQDTRLDKPSRDYWEHLVEGYHVWDGEALRYMGEDEVERGDDARYEDELSAYYEECEQRDDACDEGRRGPRTSRYARHG